MFCMHAQMSLDKVKWKFINRNQEDSNIGNNQGELSEEDSNNPSGNITGRDCTKEEFNKEHVVITLCTGTRKEYQKDL